MRIVPSLIAAAASLAVLAPSALAAPPVNDNYLASLPVDKIEFRSAVDLTEATTQPDIFNPSRDGQPLGGGTTGEHGLQGDAVRQDGLVRPHAAVRRRHRRVGRRDRLHAGGRALRVEPGQLADHPHGRLHAGRGGRPGARRQEGPQLHDPGRRGGRHRRPATLSVDYFADTDGDGEYDALDKCPEVPGDRPLRRLPAGAARRAERRLRRHRQRRADLAPDRRPRAQGREGRRQVQRLRLPDGRGQEDRTVSLTKLVGKSVRAGRQRRDPRHARSQRTGTYRFGATGSYFKWPVQANGLGKRQTRCIAAGTASKLETLQVRRSPWRCSRRWRSPAPAQAQLAPPPTVLDFEAAPAADPHGYALTARSIRA